VWPRVRARAIVQTAAKESGLNPQAKESGASAYLATLANRGLDYIWKVFPQLKPGGRVAKEKGFADTGVPASALNEAWSKGDESFFDYVYGGLSTNSNPGDAFKYRGRGFIGITGRSVYDNVGKEVGKDFVKDPDQVATNFEAASAALAGYLFSTRGGKDKTLKELNSFTDPNAALKYVLNTVAGLGHSAAEFDKQGSHLQEQFRKASEFGSLANESVTAANGGVFNGPMSGYPATLHGNEAVIPLKNGAVPVTIKSDMLANLLPKPDMDKGDTADQTQNSNDNIGGQLKQLVTEITAQLRNQMPENNNQELVQLMKDLVRGQQRMISTSDSMLQVAQN
jgi:hypothetical protein